MKNTKLIVGLGNPGERYKFNRHNIGFMSLDMYASHRNFENGILKTPNGKVNIKHKVVFEHPVILLKPQDFMNSSGIATSFAVKELQVDNSNVLVIHDDMDFEFGQFKIKSGGGYGGHKGIQSIIDKIGKDFNRFKIGIGRPNKGQIAIDYVLSDFNMSERKSFCELCNLVIEIVDSFIEHGAQLTMNHYNKKQ